MMTSDIKDFVFAPNEIFPIGSGVEGNRLFHFNAFEDENFRTICKIYIEGRGALLCEWICLVMPQAENRPGDRKSAF